MSQDSSRREYFSSSVRLSLTRGATVVKLAQVAPESIMLAERVEMSPGAVTINMQINGIDHQREMYLPRGISRDDRWVQIDELDESLISNGK